MIGSALDLHVLSPGFGNLPVGPAPKAGSRFRPQIWIENRGLASFVFPSSIPFCVCDLLQLNLCPNMLALQEVIFGQLFVGHARLQGLWPRIKRG